MLMRLIKLSKVIFTKIVFIDSNTWWQGHRVQKCLFGGFITFFTIILLCSNCDEVNNNNLTTTSKIRKNASNDHFIVN